MKAKMFMFPPLGGANRYVDIQRQCFESLGFELLPPTVSSLNAMDPGNGDIVVVNWMEASLGDEDGRLRPKGLLRILLFLFFLKRSRLPFIWVRHNKLPHDFKGAAASAARWTMNRFTALAQKVVVHSRDFAITEKHHYLPHPLYNDSQQLPESAYNNPPRFLFFGIFRPYKHLDQLLDSWPREVSLTMTGSGPEAFFDELRSIVERRKLNVEINRKFIHEEDLPELFYDFDVVIIPHIDSSAIVSGVFLQAKTFGNLILMKGQRDAADFGDPTGVASFDSEASLNDAIARIGQQSVQLNRNIIRDGSEKLNGWATHQSMWNTVIADAIEIKRRAHG